MTDSDIVAICALLNSALGAWNLYQAYEIRKEWNKLLTVAKRLESAQARLHAHVNDHILGDAKEHSLQQKDTIH